MFFLFQCWWLELIKVKNQYLKILEYLHLSFNKWPSILNSGYPLFFETTIMGTLAMVQKMIIDTLHKESKSQRVITERVAVQGVLYQSIINAKLTGRKDLGRKMCTSNRHDRKLENTVKQSRYKHLRELHKEWTESHHAQTSSGKGQKFHFWNWNIIRSILPRLREKELDCCSVV